MMCRAFISERHGSSCGPRRPTDEPHPRGLFGLRRWSKGN